MPASSSLPSATDRQLLLQLGQRLKRARIRQGMSTTEAASRAGISRMTLHAVESGEPSATMGSYLRVMSVLQLSSHLALLAEEPVAPTDVAAQGSQPGAGRPVAVTRHTPHDLQDLQSLALHQEAVRLLRKDDQLVEQVLKTLDRWRQSGDSRSRFLWDEWAVILHRRAWRRALAMTKRSKELRQASPVPTVLPPDTRQRILAEVQQLKRGATPVTRAMGQPHGET
jgi:transcriptional regulator with XRE-family HTH domain